MFSIFTLYIRKRIAKDMQKEQIIKIVKEIEPFLIHGDKADIAKNLNVTTSRVNEILNGNRVGRKGIEILKALQERAEENKKIFS